MTTLALDQIPPIMSELDEVEKSPKPGLFAATVTPHIRVLAGVRLAPCESCERQPGILSVQYPDLVIVVCYGCRP